jgi:hypothetical protein
MEIFWPFRGFGRCWVEFDCRFISSAMAAVAGDVGVQVLERCGHFFLPQGLLIPGSKSFA